MTEKKLKQKGENKLRWMPDIIFGAVTVFSSLFLILMVSGVFSRPNGSFTEGLVYFFYENADYKTWLLAIGIIIFGTAFGIMSLLVRNLYVVICAIFLPLLILWLILSFNIAVLISGIIFMITAIMAYYLINFSLQDSKKVKLLKSLRFGVPILLLGISLLVSVAFYVDFWADINERGIQISDGAFERLVLQFENKIKNDYVPGFNKDMTVEEFYLLMTYNKIQNDDPYMKLEMTSIMEKKLLDRGVNIDNSEEIVDVLAYDSDFRKEFFNTIEQSGDTVLEDEKNFLGIDGFEVKRDQRVIDAAQKYINKKLVNILGPFKRLVPFLFTLAFFVFLLALSLILLCPIYLLTWIMYKILFKSEMINIEKKLEEVEYIKVN